MRTKSLLLAAAALAAGALSSQAQTVYSANIVGYVNQTLPAGQYQLVAPTLSVTSTNSAEDVLPALQQGDSILLWSGTAYAQYTYLSPGVWVLPNGNTGASPLLGLGQGFFYLNGGLVTETNTTVGTVALTNTTTFAAGVYALVGSTPPISDSLDGTNLDLPLQQGDTVLLWNSTNSAYQEYQFLTPGTWVLPDGTTGSAPTIPVGSGFFYLNSGQTPEIWTNNITVN
jgi:uncharacterized protein YheU (UPF0270 family)